MKYTADCPQCTSEFEIAGVEAAQSGLKCPKCGIQFFPESVHRQGAAKTAPGSGLRTAAETVFIIAMIFCAASVCIGLIAPWGLEVRMFLGGGALSVGLTLILVSQLIEIRAALEKRK